VEFFHQSDYIGDVLDDVNRPDFPERTIAQWEWKLIEIRDNVGARVRIAIETDRARILVNAAPNIEYRQRF
jgi:hypothetical protein